MKKYKLFFDCCFNNLNMILLDKTNSVIDTFSIPTHNNLTDIALEYLNDFLKNNKIKNNQIDHLYITIGPGSFTGVRVCCIVGKTWCYLNKDCELYTIDSLKLQVPFDNGISVLDARGDKEYYAIYKGNVGLPKIVSNVEFETLCKDNPDLPLYKNYENVDIVECFLNNINNFKKIDDVEFLKPLYIKKPV